MCVCVCGGGGGGGGGFIRGSLPTVKGRLTHTHSKQVNSILQFVCSANAIDHRFRKNVLITQNDVTDILTTF